MSAGGWKAKPVGFCSLTESGRVEYFGGRPMFIAGPVGNYLYPVALYPHPDPVRAALVEALKAMLEEDDGGMAAEQAKAALRAAVEVVS